MNTTQAAKLAGVTPRTIRRWAQTGRINATRTGRAWHISPDQTATIGRKTYTLQETAITTPPITLTNKTRTPGAPIAALGDADELRHAFETGTPVTLSGKHVGERVYLGHSRQIYGDHGITIEKTGLDRTLGESPKYPGHIIAAYLVDMNRLQEAPTLAALKAQADAENLANAIATEDRIAAEDRRLDNLAEDGA